MIITTRRFKSKRWLITECNRVQLIIMWRKITNFCWVLLHDEGQCTIFIYQLIFLFSYFRNFGIPTFLYVQIADALCLIDLKSLINPDKVDILTSN